MKKGVFASISALLLLALLGGFQSVVPQAAAAEISPNFSLPFRTNNSKIFNLHDYPGQVIMIEFFLSWCPHCQAATPEVRTNIVNYYASRNGNPDGVPVTVVYVNLEWRAGTYQTDTDAFIAAHDMRFVLNDYNQTAYQEFGAGGTPQFVVINTVTNSSSHQPWEVIYVGNGYSAATTINTLRSKIDSVRAANLPPTLRLPRILPNNTFEFILQGQMGRTNVVEASADLSNWSPISNLVNVSGTATFRYRNPVGLNLRHYRARVQ